MIFIYCTRTVQEWLNEIRKGKMKKNNTLSCNASGWARLLLRNFDERLRSIGCFALDPRVASTRGRKKCAVWKKVRN